MDKKTLSTEEAKAALKKDQDERIKKSSTAISEILKEHNCTLDVSVILKNNSIQPHIDIIAL